MVKDSYLLPLIGAVGIFPGCKLFARQSYGNEVFFTMRDMDAVAEVFSVVMRHSGWNLALVERSPEGMIFAIHCLDGRAKETVDELALALVKRGAAYVEEVKAMAAAKGGLYVQ